ncbi:MAG: VOC family protein [Marmoricola sp.]
MTSRIQALTIDALDPAALAAFWGALVGEDPGLALRFQPTDAPKSTPNQAHFDLTSATDAAQAALVETALSLGARHHDVGQTGDEGHVVLADPEGNEFCVIEAGNRFLAGTAAIGALSCDGSRDVGHFWSQVLDWPLVWDQDEETAIQSPDGGTKISWGGPPFRAKTGKNRWHLDLVADDLDAEVERLLALGARHADIGQGETAWVVLSDPDGNEFCVARADQPTLTASASLDDSP